MSLGCGTPFGGKIVSGNCRRFVESRGCHGNRRVARIDVRAPVDGGARFCTIGGTKIVRQHFLM